MWYALLDVYSPSAVHLQIMLSSLLVSSWICCTTSHSWTYFWSSSSERIGVIWEIHLLSCKAFCTVICFLLVFLNKFGAKLLGDIPCTHDEVQNLAVLPSPIMTIVDAAKRSRSWLSHGRPSLFHALSFWRHWNHNHRSLSARAKRSKSKILSPPLIFGHNRR
jgi:hypothetical protein